MSGGSPRIYHDGTYLHKNPDWHAEDACYKTADIMTLLTKHNLRPTTICEVGCGSGGILDELSRKLETVTQLTGYEISEQALALCRPKERENLRFFQGSLPEEGIYFDLVLAIDVFEHVEDYLGFLRDLRSKGTHKIFRIPLNLSVQSVLFKSRPILRNREAYGHLHYFSKETALATLADTGYRIIDSFHSFAPISAKTIGRRNALLKSMKKACFALHPEWFARMVDGFSLMVLAE
jgi:SAM-dependent methyltransferase